MRSWLFCHVYLGFNIGLCEIAHYSNRILFCSLFYGLFGLPQMKNPLSYTVRCIMGEIFVIGVPVTVGIVTKFIGHMSSLGGGDTQTNSLNRPLS